ncbi:Cdk-activating kinase assembly factor mat1 [Thalictrum thalictroides]|uniref:Cdk-activating kinase assembly factor mat1 n=1 Tax=Thalictrum thalictroides TaxID=46969 RepID=A0A7J6WK79_THATH|nr:Cdk-activating kinase assembly factor mat1 [Thalictrum thalictroides]
MVLVSGTNSYAKEMAIRKRISNIFNKREDDFPSLRDYNDYLEEVEDMTFNLIEGIEVAAIDAKISKYQEENAEQIINARARKAEDLASALAASKGVPMQPDAIDGVIALGFARISISELLVEGLYHKRGNFTPFPYHDRWMGSRLPAARKC